MFWKFPKIQDVGRSNDPLVFMRCRLISSKYKTTVPPISETTIFGGRLSQSSRKCQKISRHFKIIEYMWCVQVAQNREWNIGKSSLQKFATILIGVQSNIQKIFEEFKEKVSLGDIRREHWLLNPKIMRNCRILLASNDEAITIFQ